MLTCIKTSRVRLILVLSISCALMVVSFIAFAPSSRAKVGLKSSATANKKSRRPPFVPGEVLVRYRTEATADAKTNTSLAFITQGQELEISIEPFEGSALLPGLRIARVPADRTLEAVAILRAQPDVLRAEPNYILHADVTNPNDQFFGNQASLTKIGATTAWDTIRGSKNAAESFFGTPQVVVAVVDQGIDINHLDLQPNIWTNPAEIAGNGVDDDANGKIDDVHGFNFVNNNGTVFSGADTETHASHVAGIIGAAGNNNKGIAGVNWAVGLMSLKFLDDIGDGSTSDAILAVQYAKLMRDRYVNTGGAQGANIRVINASFGGGGFAQFFEDAVVQANNSGILFVAAAGNIDDGTRIPNNDLVPHYPSSFNSPNIMAVAATDQTDGLAGFSHFGATSVDLGAPGVGILSTTPHCAAPGPNTCQPAQTDANGDTYSVFSGTSMSAPHVAGSAALLWAQDSNLTVQQVKNALMLSGDVVAAMVDRSLSGRRLNVGASSQTITEHDVTAPGAVTGFHVNSQNGRTLNLGWTASGDNGATGNAALYQLSFTDGISSAVSTLRGVIPANSGVAQVTDVTIPFRHTIGTITLREFDNAGNEGTPQTVAVNIPATAGDPYVPTTGSAVGLSTDTSERQNLDADDVYVDYFLPVGFSFPFFGINHTEVTISSNGALYFSEPPFRGNGDADDVPSSPGALGGFQMIAGLWEDLDLRNSVRANAGVYVVRPSASQIIFRWQAQPCDFDGNVCTGGDNVDFEIELNTNGTIKTRYGSVDANLFPTVGIGGGGPDGYVITSHTSEETPINLTNAAEVTFTPRTLVTPSIQLSQSNFSIGEAGTSVNITVTRGGDTTGASTVAYTTTDTDNFTVNCKNIAGNAFARCDFATSVDTLTFAPGEASKSFVVPIINDAYAEGPETFGVALSNVTGATLGSPSTATITINDDEAVDGPNPIFTTPFFVRQHYLDFLSREPEVGEPWSAVLNNCSDVNNNPACDRITVSGAFFGSPEFQLKGYFVYRFYKLAFDRLPLYTEIVVDMRAVTGATPTEVFQKKAAFANSFVLLSEFTNLYNAQTNAQYVNTLMGRYSLTQITTPNPATPDDTNNKVTLTTTDLINRLNGVGGTLTRAQVLRAIADSDQIFQLEFNQAFVAMQYYGYLRRTPEPSGFNAWLTFLNANPGASRTMVNGFMNSDEYRLRFGQAN